MMRRNNLLLTDSQAVISLSPEKIAVQLINQEKGNYLLILF